MKKLFLLLFSTITLCAAVQAQDSTLAHQPHRGRAVQQQRMDMMGALNLTEAQKASIAQLRQRQKTQMDSIRNSGMTAEEKTTRMKALRDSGRQQVEAVLTPEQKSTMQQMRAAQMEKRKAAKQEADSTQQ